jgi:hypothetical protein
VLAEKPLYVAGFCYSPRPLLLERGGTYVLSVRGLGRTVGRYAFTVWDAPVEEFSMRTGTLVAPGRPARGAGRLEVAGSVDRYAFTAKAGSHVVVDAREVDGWCGRGQMLRSSLYSDVLRAPVLEAQLLYSNGSCYDGDAVKLPVDGRYALIVYGDPPAWDHGPYALLLVPVVR